MRALYVSNECEKVHKLVDRGTKPIIDQDYSVLLNHLEEFFEKFGEMAAKLNIRPNAELMRQLKKERDKYDQIDSRMLRENLHHCKDSLEKKDTKDSKEEYKAMKIIYENEATNKACCNDKCYLY